jgi:glycosyltransferase involved in cell wall biosynthesis
MRILFLCNRIPWPLNDGGNLATWNLALHLQQEGHSLELACLNTQKHFIKPEEVPVVFKALHVIPINTSLSPWGFFLNIFSPLPYIAERFVSDRFKQMLQNLLVENSFDIIQLEGLYMSPYIEYIRKFSKAPIVLRAHNVEFKIWERLANASPNLLKKLYLRSMAKNLRSFEQDRFSKVNGILFFTEEDARLGEALNLTKPHVVIPSGIVIPEWPTETNAQQNTVGFIGNMEWLPNQDAVRWFVEAIFPLIKKQIPNVRFLLAGKNIPGSLLSGLNSEGVEIVGQVENAQAFIQSLSAFVVPLRAGGGMRLKILEAMASGAAIVSTPIGAEGIEGVRNQHFKIEEKPVAFAEAVIQVLNSDTYQAQLGAAAYKNAQLNYAWKPIAQKTLNFYQQIV